MDWLRPSPLLPKAVFFGSLIVTNIFLILLVKFGVQLAAADNEEPERSNILVTSALASTYFGFYVLGMIGLLLLVLVTPQGRMVAKAYSLLH
jgi:hypothetical protein